MRFDDYETSGEVAKRLGVDASQIRRYCEQDRFPGAFKFVNRWLIPKGTTPKLKDFGRPPSWSGK